MPTDPPRLNPDEMQRVRDLRAVVGYPAPPAARRLTPEAAEDGTVGLWSN